MLAKTAVFIIVSGLFLGFSGCGGGDGSAPGANEVNNSGAASPSNSATPEPIGNIEKTPEPQKSEEAVTLKPVVEAYCDAMRKKDDAALRKVYSRASLASFDSEMRKEGIRSLAEYLSIEPVGNKCDVVNERIQGSVGEALVITKSYPNGIPIKFVKEGSEWKMTNQSSDFESVTGKN